MTFTNSCFIRYLNVFVQGPETFLCIYITSLVRFYFHFCSYCYTNSPCATHTPVVHLLINTPLVTDQSNPIPVYLSSLMLIAVRSSRVSAADHHVFPAAPSEPPITFWTKMSGSYFPAALFWEPARGHPDLDYLKPQTYESWFCARNHNLSESVIS